MTEENKQILSDYFSGKRIFKPTEKDDWEEAIKERDEKLIEHLIKTNNLVKGINERLINEYISKVGCCDECFASIYCTVNRLRESRVPQDYCVKNIKRYFVDNANEEQTDGYECSVCKRTYHTRVPYFSEYKYCPNCGAEMRGNNNG